MLKRHILILSLVLTLLVLTALPVFAMGQTSTTVSLPEQLQSESPSVAEQDAGQDAEQDIWFVDLIPVARIQADKKYFPRLRFYRLDNRRWKASDAETFYQTQQPEIPLIVFAQGYTLTPQQTTEVGLGLVKTFDRKKPCRVVFWHWYSEKVICNIRRDIRSKISIADSASDFLALFMESLKPQSKVCLFGFSFGSRIISNAAEALQENDRIPEGLRLHLVMSGAASDRNWFAQGNRHGLVPQIAEKILITYSSSDWVLRLYPLIYDLRHPAQALGLEGLPILRIAPEFRDRFENVNVFRYIGNDHQTLLHVQTPAFQNRVNTYFFFGE